MCGISGIVGDGASSGVLSAMVAAQHHRGPDRSGESAFADGRCLLGHNRLSIVDLSRAGDQPMVSASGKTAVTFNGEIYNHIELRSEIGDYPYRSNSDTEVILAAYEKWGLRAFERFIGMFAFAIWDEEKQHLICVRDRLGIKPFLYAVHERRFLFASEAKALLAAGVSNEPDNSAWRDYLIHGMFDHSQRTFFHAIRSLGGGHYFIIDGNGVPGPEVPFWSLADASGHYAEAWRGDIAEAQQRLRVLIDDAVSLRLRADVPVGVNLSGGLDSSILAATIGEADSQTSSARLAFTMAFGDLRYDECDYSEAVLSGQSFERHVHLFQQSDMLAGLSSAVRTLEAPFGGVPTMAYMVLHKRIRSLGLKVSMEGQGMDEMFGGYGYFKAARLIDLARDGFRALRQEIASDKAGYRPWLTYARNMVKTKSQAPIYYDGTSPLDIASLSRGFIDDGGNAGNKTPPRFDSPFPDALRTMLYRDLRHTKLPRVLRMNDLASMRHSVELREPFLDHRIVEFAFSLPGEMMISGGVAKRLPRLAFHNRLPAKTLDAPKRYVVSPQREWLRGPLSEMVRDIISSKQFRERGYFDAKSVEKSYDSFVAGQGDNSFFVWQWINTELWFREFADKPKQAVCPV